MFDEISFDMERSGFFHRLRELTHEDRASLHKVHQICDYIYWAKQSDMELFFDLSDEDYNRCLIVKEKGTYTEFLAHEELTTLPIYQLMGELAEFS